MLQLWEPSRFTFGVQDALGLTQQTGRQPKAQPAAEEAEAALHLLPPGDAATPGTPADDVAQASLAAESPGRLDASPPPPSAAAAASPPCSQGRQEDEEPPAKRRALVPLATFALPGAQLRSEAQKPAKVAAPQQQPAQQKSLFRFGFQRTQSEPEEQHPESPGDAAAHVAQAEPAARSPAPEDRTEPQAGSEDDEAMYALTDDEGAEQDAAQLAAASEAEDDLVASELVDAAYDPAGDGDITVATDMAGMRLRLLAAAARDAASGSARPRNRSAHFAAASLAGKAGGAGLSREQAEAVAGDGVCNIFMCSPAAP